MLGNIASPVSILLASTGVSLLAVATSFQEHSDILEILIGISALILAFWLRDWKVKRETFEKFITEKIDSNERVNSGEMKLAEIRIARLEEDGKHIRELISGLATESRDFHSWAYKVIGGLSSTLTGGKNIVESIHPLISPSSEEKERKDNE